VAREEKSERIEEKERKRGKGRARKALYIS
jgi:hypothetical protein